jgi:hypothetical protein
MDHDEIRILKKKPVFPVNKELKKYLFQYQREARLPLSYDDLLEFRESVPLIDKYGKDTLWESPVYPHYLIDKIHEGLKKIYAMLNTSGNVNIVQHKYIDRIDYCTFGNTRPFRIRIVNPLNDVNDYFYIKRADASRIYGLELEDIISPNHVSYLVNESTLVEEHIAGIPGDLFARNHLGNPEYNHTKIAKEFVKFNERCMITLLGDMRSYNFVLQITPDFDDFQFRIRPVDFDQQFYEGNMKVYMPQFYKENYQYVKLAMEHLSDRTVWQYQQEERSMIVHRVRGERHRLAALRHAAYLNPVSTFENTRELAGLFSKYYDDAEYLKCANMADIVAQNLKRVIRQVKIN